MSETHPNPPHEVNRLSSMSHFSNKQCVGGQLVSICESFLLDLHVILEQLYSLVEMYSDGS